MLAPNMRGAASGIHNRQRAGPAPSIMDDSGPDPRPSQWPPAYPRATWNIWLLLLCGVLSLSPPLDVAIHIPPSGAGSTVRSRP